MIKVDISVREGRGKSGQWSLDSDLSGQMTAVELAEFMKHALLTISQQALTESQSKGEFPKDPKDFLVATDGRLGKHISDVKPFGKIEFQRKVDMGEVILFIFDEIMKRSPVLTSQFYQNNILTLNGNEVGRTRSEIDSFMRTYSPKQADIFRFVNTMPYAKRLEVRGIIRGRERGSGGEGKRRERIGRNRKTGGTFRAPTGTYHLATQAANKRYRLNSVIKFKMISGAEMQIPAGVNTLTGKPHRRKTLEGIAYIYPSVYLYVREWAVAGGN